MASDIPTDEENIPILIARSHKLLREFSLYTLPYTAGMVIAAAANHTCCE